MSKYTIVHFKEVPPQRFGHDSEEVDIRFYRDQLKMSGGGMTVMKLGPGINTTPHRHKQQEEIYLVIDGDVEIKLEDEIIELKALDAVRVPKETARALRNSGKESAMIIAFGTPNTGPGDSISVDYF